MTELLKKGEKFEWGQKCEDAFHTLRKHLTTGYEIIEACGPVAYKLKLPPKMSAIHNVVQVSQ
jgi:hypothetical protein